MRYPYLILLVCILCSQLSATSFYLDATNGDDTDDGLSPATAWKTLQRLRSPTIALSAGDTVRLKRGEVWRQQLYIDYASIASAPVVFTDYGSSTDSLPIITSIDLLPGADNAAGWIEIAPNIWAFNQNQTPGRLFIDGNEVLRASVIDSLGYTDAEGALGRWFWHQPDSTLQVYETQNPGLAYAQMEGSLRFYSSVIVFGGNFIFENIDFQGGWGSSLAFIISNGITIRNCKLGRYGNTGLILSGGQTNLGFFGSSDFDVTDNDFDSDFTFFYGLGSERGCGDGVLLINDVQQVRVENNVFKNWAHNAIELRGDIALAAGVNNNTFSQNHISAPDIPYAHPLGADGFEGKCQFNRFTRNTIENCRTASQINGNNNTVDHNIVRSMRRSPSKESATAYAFITSVYGANLVSHDNVFDHNLIIDTDEAAFLVINYGFPEEVTGHKFRNNICYETGLTPYNDAYPAGTAIVMDEEGVGGNTFQNNLLFTDLPTAVALYLNNTGETFSVTELNARNGDDGDVVSANLSAHPNFTDFAAGDYLPALGAPTINAGLDLGYLVDFVGADRNQGGTPDIGPLETDVLLPVTFDGFELHAAGKQSVQLQWSTQTETNTDRFGVERNSGDGWRYVGEVAAAGFSRTELNYEFLDREAPIGILYYRLRQTDFDGSYTYSPIREIELTAEEPILRWLTSHTVALTFPNGERMEDASIIFYSIDGRNLPFSISESQVRFSTNLPSGIYLLVVNGKALKMTLP